MSTFETWTDIAAIIEHTAVGPDVSRQAALALANEVNVYDFHAAVVTPHHVETVTNVLEPDRSLVVVIGYPYGIDLTPAKLASLEAVNDAVDEVDVVMNRIAFADGEFAQVKADIEAVADATGDRPLKVIIETPVLSTYEIEQAATLVVEAGADFVKTAVGYDGPASPRHVEIIRETVGEAARIKAAGGIRTYADVLEMVNAGADRIGTSSGLDIHATTSEDLQRT